MAKKRKRKSSVASSLFIAASAIQGMTFTPCAHAEGATPGSEIRFGFYNYTDRQSSGDRMTIYAPMAWVRSALSDQTEIQAGFVLDSTSGASPMYHDTLSGASGKGIRDRRAAEDLNVTHYFEDFSLTAGVSESCEDDYDSFGGSLESKFWTSDNNTIFNIGISGSSDNISSSNDPTLDEHKGARGFGIGVTQVLDQNSTLQSNLTFAGSRGFQNDPYKTLDLRPQSRDEIAWLTRYAHYFSDYDAALHVDYRFFADSWGVAAHTAEIGWSQAINEDWILSPHLRFYTQEKSEFYSNEFPPDSPGEHFFTADQRLSGFGSITAGVGVSRNIGSSFNVSASIDFMQQRGAWKIGSPGSPGLDPMSALMFGVGMQYRF